VPSWPHIKYASFPDAQLQQQQWRSWRSGGGQTPPSRSTQRASRHPNKAIAGPRMRFACGPPTERRTRDNAHARCGRVAAAADVRCPVQAHTPQPQHGATLQTARASPHSAARTHSRRATAAAALPHHRAAYHRICVTSPVVTRRIGVASVIVMTEWSFTMLQGSPHRCGVRLTTRRCGHVSWSRTHGA
jgi:hypothetical protein